MSKLSQLESIKALLSQALSKASNSHNPSVQEASGHIRQALTKIEVASQNQVQRKKAVSSQFATWWGEIQAGTIAQSVSPVSQEVQQKTLDELNAMISKEQARLDALAQAAQKPTPNQLLKD